MEPISLTRARPEFLRLLERSFALEALEAEPATVFGLASDGTIAYVNPAWERFAQANGGQDSIARSWGLGARYLDAIPEPLRPFYRGLLARARPAAEALHPVSHQYNCSSARVFRTILMQVYALPDDQGYVIVNSLQVEHPHDPMERPSQEPDLALFGLRDGVAVPISQCAHCRRVQRPDDASRWHWVPVWVERAPDTATHTICPVCFEYYYPGA